MLEPVPPVAFKVIPLDWSPKQLTLSVEFKESSCKSTYTLLGIKTESVTRQPVPSMTDTE